MPTVGLGEVWKVRLSELQGGLIASKNGIAYK